MFYLFRPLRFLTKALTREATAKQLAWGFALGILIGLVPKGNLIAIVLMSILCMLRVNLGMGMLTAFVVSWIGIFADPVTHLLGQWLLTVESLVPAWTWLYDQPVMPWTSFNNTVVLGSTVLGLVLLLPAYFISRPLFEKYSPKVAEKLERYRAAKVLLGAEFADRLGGT